MEKLCFTKMHGCGNDYIYFDCITPGEDGTPVIPKDPSALSRALSPRRKAVGGDGVVLMGPSDCADLFMRMFNADGSEGRMCGNAIRCCGKYAVEHGIASGDAITIETLNGVKVLHPVTENGVVTAMCVELGLAELNPEKIPALLPETPVVGATVNVAGRQWSVTCVGMGSAHCVTFVDDPAALDLEKIGPLFENNSVFPDRINTEFVQVIGRDRLKMRVWEKGSGETWACGTGASASTVAAVLNGFCDEGNPVCVEMVGGELTIEYRDGKVFMTGPATEAFTGAALGEAGGVWPKPGYYWDGRKVL